MNSREDQIISLIPWVHRAAKIVKRQSYAEDLDDLIGDGMIGAIHAVDRYDPDEGVNLETFAWRRIKGEIIDGIRRRRGDSRNKHHATETPLDTASKQGRPLIDVLPDDEDAFERIVDQLAIQTVISRLREKYRTILCAYFFNDMNLRQIGDDLGVSEARASQLLREARHAAYEHLQQESLVSA